MIVGRRLVLLLVEQARERGVLLGTALQDQQHPIQRQGCRSRAAIKARKRQRVSIATEG